MRSFQPARRVMSACVVASLVQPLTADACSRAVYFGEEGQTVTGRTMDWTEDLQTNLYLFPRGMERDGAMGEASFRWTSLYGSVVATAYEGGTADGMNEKGLVVNLLYLVESQYPASDDPRPAVVIGGWGQYVLDRFATVAEAVDELRHERFRVAPVIAPNGQEGTLHLSISDPTGDSAIFEYIDGKLNIHHSRAYQVMTNSPVFEQQLAINAYWKDLGGTVMLPGTNRAADRFARLSFYINAVRQSSDPREAVASVFSAIRNVSVPRGITTPGQPNISSTIWRTVADQKNGVYFYESTLSPGVVWVKLRELDFARGSGVRKLTLHGNDDVTGDQTRGFKPAEPFKFLSPIGH